jgi:hypothetical protein
MTRGLPPDAQSFGGYRVERTSSERELHPPKSSAFHGALFRRLLNRFLVMHLRIGTAESGLDKFDE